ncbi:hypothetical protein Tco_0963482 [Tanacetum coccineum]
MFELYCRSLGISPTVNLFHVFYKISKQGHWFSFKKRVGKGAGGKIFQESFSEMKGWKDKFFFLYRRTISDATAWRHHDYDVNDMLPDDGFSMEDVKTLAEKVIDLRPVHSGLFFSDGLATIEPNTTPPFSVGEPILDKTEAQLEVEVEDPKVVTAREKKKAQVAKNAAKKNESRKRVNDEGESFKMTTKRRKALTVRENQTTGCSHISSPTPLRTVASTGRVVTVQSGFDEENEKTQNAPKGASLAHHSAHHTSSFGGPLSQPRETLRGLHAEDGESSRSGEIYVLE